MHRLIDDRRTEIAILCQRYSVRRLEVFGSAARGTDFRPESSDADFLVSFEPENSLSPLEQFFGFSRELERLLGRPVDLVEAGSVHNPFIRAEVDSARELVYAA
jgi:uncharacterized protein